MFHLKKTVLYINIMLSQQEKQRVDDVYFNLKNGGGFLGPSKIHLILKSKGYNTPGLYKIRKYLQTIDSYSLQKPPRRTFKRARVEVSGPYEQYDADLADVSNISKTNNGTKFLLVVIDVFSRYLWVEPLMSKTGKEVLKAFQKIIARGHICKRLRTDKGGEFSNRWMKKWCQENDIHYFTTQNEIHANFAERVIRTLKSMMYRYFTKFRTYQYIDKLQQFVTGYNATPHRSLNKIAPKDVNASNKAELFGYMYLTKKHSSKIHKRKIQKRKIPYKFKIGSLVRISHLKQPFTRSYQQQWSAEIFKVKNRFLRQGIPQYQLIDLQDDSIKGTFYQSELQRTDSSIDALWYIEKKIKKRKRNGQVEWLVKFENWPSKYNQWISESEIKDTTD